MDQAGRAARLRRFEVATDSSMTLDSTDCEEKDIGGFENGDQVQVWKVLDGKASTLFGNKATVVDASLGNKPGVDSDFVGKILVTMLEGSKEGKKRSFLPGELRNLSKPSVGVQVSEFSVVVLWYFYVTGVS